MTKLTLAFSIFATITTVGCPDGTTAKRDFDRKNAWNAIEDATVTFRDGTVFSKESSDLSMDECLNKSVLAVDLCPETSRNQLEALKHFGEVEGVIVCIDQLKSDDIQLLEDLTRLKSLTIIGERKFSLEEIETMQHRLTQLGIIGCEMTDEEFKDLSKFRKLEALSLARMELVGEKTVDQILQLECLKSLTFTECGLLSFGKTKLQKANLDYLRLDE